MEAGLPEYYPALLLLASIKLTSENHSGEADNRSEFADHYDRHGSGTAIAIRPESLSASSRNRYRHRPGTPIGMLRNTQLAHAVQLLTGGSQLPLMGPVLFDLERPRLRGSHERP